MENRIGKIIEEAFLSLATFGGKVVDVIGNFLYGLQKQMEALAERSHGGVNFVYRSITSIAIVACYCIIILIGGSLFVLLLSWFTCLGMSEVRNLTDKLSNSEKRVKLQKLGFLWVFTTFGSIGAIRMMEQQGFVITLWMFAVIVVVDSCAYVIGKLFGLHKLLPLTSPGKTVEGSIAGSIAGVAVSMFFYSVYSKDHSINRTVLFAILSLVVVILSQLGDAVQSYIKRRFGVKDIGFIVIGHGGVMDRFDSFMIVAPFVLLLAIFTNGQLFF